MNTDLAWLPVCAEWSDLLRVAREQEPADALRTFQKLALSQMDFVRAGRLDKAVERYRLERGFPAETPRLRLALLGSSTMSHLVAGIRLGALRRGLLVDVYEGPYGQYRQELVDRGSGLHAFRPEVVCLALDADHLASAEHVRAEDVLAGLQDCWALAQTTLGCAVVQQTALPRLPRLMGNAEAQLPSSPARVLEEINSGLRESAGRHGVHLLAVDTWAAQDGLAQWHDRALWFTAKQEIHPRVSQVYGDQVGRVLAALRGRSAKCLVLDLDNTLWGGVIGDDGLHGIVLGQGGAAAEAYTALQRYALQLAQRGVILAVCSKNDESNALAPFDSHPEMVLRRKDIACFVANWRDKASNLREIAERLNIGLDALVFVDDNPAERALVRRELPMVAVPELPEDAAGYVPCLAAAGYFEAVSVTDDDRERTERYRANAERESIRHAATDMEGYLRALEMELVWSSFAEADLGRVAQLINKTNQFNLTTRRRTEAEVVQLLADSNVLTLQLRLRDVYGDNGLIAVVIARRTAGAMLEIDTWLMSCRVLGREVEAATLNILADLARAQGCVALVGEYRPTPKNGLVRELYERLGFLPLRTAADGSATFQLKLESFTNRPVQMRVLEGDLCRQPSFTAS